MRALALPASLALAFALYLPFPALADRLPGALARGYRAMLRRFTDKRGRADMRLALAAYLALLGGAAALLGAVHPALAAVCAAPLYTALAEIPRAAEVKRGLDGGSHAGDVPGYEALVRARCARLLEAFVPGACVPLLLGALGTPLYLGGALGWAALALRALDWPEAGRPARLLAALDRAAARAFTALMLLCSCLVGRSPFRTRGRGVSARGLSILGIAEGDKGGHAPVAGDLAQAAFLGGFCASLLCAALTLAVLPLTRL